MSHDALKDLHTAILDAREGYRTAIEKAETPAVASKLREVDALHGAAHSDVHALLAANGVSTDDRGSLMGDVHQAVISVRSAITGIDDGSLASFAKGEDRIVAAYDKAIAEEADADAATTLRKHRDRLAAKAAELRAQADAG